MPVCSIPRRMPSKLNSIQTHSRRMPERKIRMRNKTFEQKVIRDIETMKKDLAKLGDDSVTGLSRKYEQLADDTKKKAVSAVQAVNQRVEQGLSQYNAKVQDMADRVPGDFAKKAAGYPWVTVTMSLVFGLLLGALLKPGRRLT